MKVGIIEAYNSKNFEEKVNLFIENREVIDIKYATTDYKKNGYSGVEYYSRHSALIIYK